MSVSLKKHHAKAPVQMRRYFAMENVRKRLCNVTVNVWMKIMSFQIVMEPAQNANLKIGSAILNVSPVKNLATENALKVNLNF
jgi:hypothetical protein